MGCHDTRIEGDKCECLRVTSQTPIKAWCNHAFSFYPKCEVIMNNVYETFNSTILVAMDKTCVNG